MARCASSLFSVCMSEARYQPSFALTKLTDIVRAVKFSVAVYLLKYLFAVDLTSK